MSKHTLFSILLSLLLLVPVATRAQEAAPDNTLGGWAFVDISHALPGRFSLSGHFEVDSYQFSRLDRLYSRLAVGYKALPWLKVGVNYVPLYRPGQWKHFVEADATGTLRSEGLKVAIRERLRYGITTGTHELRSRLKVDYRIPDTPLTPYLAAEVFTRGDTWLMTRHYLACCYAVSPRLQLEGYYLYHTFSDAPAEHVFALGILMEL